MAYETILVFSVAFIAVLLFDVLTQKWPVTYLQNARQIWLFLVLGLYFVYFWCHGGQTLAMKTWRIKLTAPGHDRVPQRQAILRYLLAWLWFLPAIMLHYVLGLTIGASIGVILAGIGLWAMTALFDKDRQFLHDRLAGTRLVSALGFSLK
jgi:uncharacterized RDD family membrane protein YckC